MTWVAVSIGASAVVGGVQAFTGGKAKAELANQTIKDKDREIVGLQNSMAKLGPAQEAGEEVVQTDYLNKTKNLGESKDEALKGLKKTIEGTGMVTTTGGTESKASLWSKVSQNTKGIKQELFKNMAGVAESFAKERQKLAGMLKRANLQKKAAESQADAWYLGKHITGG